MTQNRSVAARSSALPIIAIGALLFAAGCGVPRDAKDRPLAPNEIAYTPQAEPTTTTTIVTTTTTTTPPATTVDPQQTSTTVTPTTVFIAFPLDVYWIDGSMVRPIRRNNVKATLESAIDALRAGPLFPDTAVGLRSAIPSSDMIDSATVESGTATIDLAPSFLTLPGTEQILAIAQIVYTVTNLPGTGLVEFSLGGRPLSVPTSNGQPSRGALSRDDYVSLLAAETPSIGAPTGVGTTTTTSPAKDHRSGAY